MTLPQKFDTVGSRIGLALASVLLGLAVVIASGVLGLARLERQIGALVNVSAVKDEAAAQMHLAIVERVDAVRNIALTTEINAMADDQARIEASTARYARSRARLTELGLSDDERAALASADKAEAAAAPLLKQAQALARTMQPEMAAEILTRKLGPVQQQWTQALTALSAHTEAASGAVLAATQAARRQTLVWMCSAGALALVVGTLLATGVARGIARRLRRAVALTRDIAAGRLGAVIDVRGSDEVAQTLQALAAMQERLRGTIGEVRAAARSIETASSEIAAGSSDLSARTEQSAASLQQTASSMEELSSTVKGSADNAATASRLASSASEVAERGGAMVMQVVTTMQEINASSRKIGDIVGTIDGIAFQTNILALNAAVEAARAGEQGRGFAVVASEVRSLAQRSAQAAREVKALIGASMDKVEAGTRLVADTGATMNDIVASVKRVSDVIADISHSVSEQSRGIGQINSAVSQLDHATQQNAALVEESAAAGSTMREQTTRLTRSVEAFQLDAVAR